jgi:hypothetical protein
MRVFFSIAVFSLIFPLVTIAQWEKVGYRGGTVSIHAYDSVWVGTTGNDIYLSTDDGDSWQLSTNGLPISNILEIRQLFYRNDTVFIRLSSSRHSVYPHFTDSVLFIRTHKDRAWSTIPNLLSFPDANRKEISKDTILYVGEPLPGSTDYGYFHVSIDGGETWQKRLNGLPDTNAFLYNFKYINRRCFASVSAGSFNNGYYYSDDFGLNWIKLVPSLNTGQFEYLIQGDLNSLFIITYSLQSDTSMFVRSTDNGTSWSNGKDGIDLKQIREINIFESFGDVVFATFRGANHPFGTSSCYLSLDKGKTWTNKTDLSSLGIYSLTGRRKHKNDGYLLSTYNSLSDIYVVDTGFSIIKRYDFIGTLESQLRTAYVDDSIICAFPSYYRDSSVISIDNGNTWEKRRTSFEKAIVNSIWKKGRNFIFRFDDISSISSYEYTKEIYRSSDKGSSWIPIQMPIPEPSAFRIVHSNDTLFVLYTYPDSVTNRCFHSYDGGLVWEEANTPFVYPWKVGDVISDNNTILIYTDNYQTYSYTTDYGVTWQNVEIPFHLYGERIVRYDLVDDTRYIFGVKGSGYNTKPRILTSQQYIDEWSEKITNLPDYALPEDIVRYKNILFLLSISWLENSNHDGSTRLYKSHDNGSTWVQIGEALPTGHSLHFTDDFIFISGYYNTLYRYPLALAGIHDSNPNSNNSLSLAVYPNPATNELTISLTSARPERVVMYDMTGALIKSGVVEGETTWDVSALASGSYMLGIPGGRMHVVQIVK